jgi:hypothetical protein
MTSRAPWEKEADRYGIGAAKLLWSMPIALQSAGRSILEGSIARGETQLEALDQLIGFNYAMRDFGPPRRAQPQNYAKTLRRQPWGERCVRLIGQQGMRRARVIELAVKALNEKRQGIECTVPEFSDLPTDGGTGTVSPSLIARLVKRTREEHSDERPRQNAH